jgi:hypothetical protein
LGRRPDTFGRSLFSQETPTALPRGVGIPHRADVRWSAPKPRRRGQPQRAAATQAITILYPNGIPGQTILPSKKLFAEVREHLLKHLQIGFISDTTILRAAGRR